jgi:ketosteroid isomerase-like protein
LAIPPSRGYYGNSLPNQGDFAMRLFRALVLPIAILGAATFTFAQSHTADANAIRAILDKQVVDWNRGDIDTFVTSYKNSPDILFMGQPIARGYQQMVERYRRVYSTHEKMGTLTFSNLEVQPLDAHFATTTGNFHLDRIAAAGGNVDGYFLLVFEKTSDGWKIIRDATTVPPKK